jgi:hypothetical protein
MLHETNRRKEVLLEHSAPVRARRVDPALRHTVGSTRVVHEDVEPAQRLEALPGHGGGAIVGRQVTYGEWRQLAVPGDLGRGRLDPRAVAAVHDDDATFGGERRSNRLADATAAAGDKRPFADELKIHLSSSMGMRVRARYAIATSEPRPRASSFDYDQRSGQTVQLRARAIT